MDKIKCAREKYWSELNNDEKVERLRKEVKYLKNADHYLRQAIGLLKQHRHDSRTGALLVELEEKYQSGGFGTGGHEHGQDDDVYI